MLSTLMIALIDYEIGNLRSVAKAVEHVGGEVTLVRTPEDVRRADKIILPGVAAFGDAMVELNRLNLVGAIREQVARGVPYLGFCLGLQLLFDMGYEDGEFTGLGIVPGKVIRLDPPPPADPTQRRLPVPHMGWNQIHLRGKHPMLAGIADMAYVYFAHSYHVVPADPATVVATTDYGQEFVSAVAKDNVFATQFHPEKRQAIGLRLLRNFVEM